MTEIEVMQAEKDALIAQYGTEGLELRSFGGAPQGWIIKGPGKFEGLSLYIEWFYDKSNEGLADYEIDMSRPEDDTEDEGFYEESYGPITFIFQVTESDRLVWPELENKTHIGFWTREDGLVVTLDSAECAREIDWEEDGNE